MSAHQNKFFRRLFIVAIAILFIRFLPVLIRVFIRLGQAIVIGFRAYWWAIVPAMLVGWVIWRLKRRRAIVLRIWREEMGPPRLDERKS